MKYILLSLAFISNAAMAIEPFSLTCKNRQIISRGESTEFDASTGEFIVTFSPDSNEDFTKVLDVFNIPLSEYRRQSFFRLRVEFDPESCTSPASPYAFSGAGCQEVRAVSLDASEAPFYRPVWKYHYTASPADIQLNSHYLDRVGAFGTVYKSVELDLNVQDTSYRFAFGSVCESQCTRNGVVVVPPVSPMPSFCERGGGI